MKASYGYQDGSGDYFITIDTQACDGCGDCVGACPAGLFEVGEDENDPLADTDVATVVADKRRKLQFECSGCKPTGQRPALACIAACPGDAIAHSW